MDDQESIRIQAEDLALEGFQTQNIDAADDGTVIRLRQDDPGTASVDLATLGISAGTHSIAVTFFDESDGVSTIDVQIDGVSAGSITMDQDGGGNGAQAENIRTVTLEGIDIPDGATLTLVGYADAGEQVRIDYVEVTPTEDPTPGPNLIIGTEMRDSFVGTNGDDQIEGLGETDFFMVSEGNDIIVGGEGFDVFQTTSENPDIPATLPGTSFLIDLRSGTASYTLPSGENYVDQLISIESAWGASEADTIYGDDNNNGLEGRDGNDALFAGGGDDYVTGGNGDDVIEGGEGADFLYGGPGNDIISGGLGNDYILGDVGADLILFRTGDGTDSVDAFDTREDVIDVSDFGLTASEVVALVQRDSFDPVVGYIDFGNGDRINFTLETEEALLTEANFIGNGPPPPDPLRLSLTTSDDQISESESTVVTVSRTGGDLSTSLLVTLVSSSDEITFPTQVTILENQTSVSFTVSGVDDGLVDGDQLALIEASVQDGNANSANLTIEVVDINTSPPPPPPPPPPSGDPVRVQAEDMDLDVFRAQNIDAADAGAVIRIRRDDTGTASADLAALGISAGTHSIAVTFFDESDGVSTIDVQIDGVSVGSITMDQDGGGNGAQAENIRTVTLEGIEITDGATLTLVGTADAGEQVRIDYVEVTPTGDPTPGPNLILGTSGDDVLIGTDEDDLIQGLEGNDELQARGGSDIVEGGDGDDDLFALGDHTLRGGNGDDFLFALLGDSTLDGGPGNDVFTVAAGAHTITTGAGQDRVNIGGNTTVTDFDITQDIAFVGTNATGAFISYEELLSFAYQDGADTVFVFSPNTILRLNDVDLTQLTESNFFGVLPAPTGPNEINGTDDADSIFGTSDDDIITALMGDDIINGSLGSDQIDGGLGNDTLYWDQAGHNLAANLAENLAQVTRIEDFSFAAATFVSIENVTGGQGNDFIIGDDGSNALSGQGGDDFLSGGNGADTIDGGDGDDRINGGDGDDYLAGGRGTDIINAGAGQDYISAILGDDIITTGSGADIVEFSFFPANIVITDFDLSEDLINLSTIAVTFSELLNITNDTPDGAVITFGPETSITLEGVLAADITEANFIGIGPPPPDPLRLFLTALDDQISEGESTVVTVSRTGGDLSTSLLVTLASSSDEITFPTQVTILENQTSVSFTVSGVDDGLVDGDQLALIEASVQDGNANSANLTIEVVDINTPPPPPPVPNEILGTADDDTLIGTDEDDIIRGLDGNDVLSGRSGNDILEGGSGDDQLFDDFGDDALFGGDGNDYLENRTGDSMLDGGAGNDRIYPGLGGSDIITTGTGQDIVGLGSDVTVTDFDIAQDSIDGVTAVTGATNVTLLDVLAFATQDGADTIFEFNDGRMVRLNNIDMTLLTEANFIGVSPPSPPSGDPVRVQAEDMDLTIFRTQNIDAADEGTVIRNRTDEPGTASVDLASVGISAGTHSISVTFFDESDGVSTIDVQIDGVTVGSITMDQDGGGNGSQVENIRTVTLEGIDIPDGATLTLVGYADAGEQVRIDYVEITPEGAASAEAKMAFDTEATAMLLPEVFDFTGLSSLPDQGPSDVFEQYRIETAQADQTGDHVARYSEPLDFQIDPFEEAFDLAADDWGGLA